MDLLTQVRILKSKHKLSRGTRYLFDVEDGIARFRTKRKLVMMPEELVSDIEMEVLDQHEYLM